MFSISETVIWWSVIDIITPFASKDLRQIWTTYLDEIMEVEIGESRSMNCATAVNDLMGLYFFNIQKIFK